MNRDLETAAELVHTAVSISCPFHRRRVLARIMGSDPRAGRRMRGGPRPSAAPSRARRRPSCASSSGPCATRRRAPTSTHRRRRSSRTRATRRPRRTCTRRRRAAPTRGRRPRPSSDRARVFPRPPPPRARNEPPPSPTVVSLPPPRRCVQTRAPRQSGMRCVDERGAWASGLYLDRPLARYHARQLAAPDISTRESLYSGERT